MFRSKVALFVGVLFASVAVLGVQGQPTYAGTGGYPYPDKPCIWAPYIVHSTKANWCRNYDWGNRRNDSSSSNVTSSYGYSYRNCTDYAAWRLHMLGVSSAQYKGLGNAKRWASPPSKKGLRVDATPTAQSVAVRTTGTYGHVAFVEAIHPDGTIRVSQYNKRGDGNYSEQTGTPTALGFTRFVHFDDYLPPPPSVPASQPVIPPPLVIPEEPPPAVTVPAQPESAPVVAAQAAPAIVTVAMAIEPPTPIIVSSVPEPVKSKGMPAATPTAKEAPQEPAAVLSVQSMQQTVVTPAISTGAGDSHVVALPTVTPPIPSGSLQKLSPPVPSIVIAPTDTIVPINAVAISAHTPAFPVVGLLSVVGLIGCAIIRERALDGRRLT